jgi:hypothetical protein
MRAQLPVRSADQAVASPVSSLARERAGLPPVAAEALREPGEALPAEARAFFEPRFGADFGDVRIHTGPRAAEAADAVAADAFTLGRDVVFGGGRYAPGSGGRGLVAHELAHVVQQGGRAGVAPAQAPDLEAAADRAGSRVAAGLSAQVRPAPAPTGLGVPQLKPKERAWKGAHLDEEAVIKYLMKVNKISEAEAKKQAPAIIAQLKQQGELVVAGFPGLKDKKFDYDLFQDVVIGSDRKPPNCFGDVCKGGKQRWEPDKAELDAWLKQEGYTSTKKTDCECGLKKVAVYEITLTYADGGKSKTLVQPYHIAEQQEDCTWRSRLGDLGVIIHERAEQLVSKAAAEVVAKDWASAGKVAFQSSSMAVLCYAKKHDRADYHGSPGGPLPCPGGKKEKAEKKEKKKTP